MPRLFEETTSSERLAARRRAFARQDGLAMLPILAAFVRRRVFARLSEGVNTRALQEETGARLGYLLIALRALASLGWLAGWRGAQTQDDLDRGLDVELTAAGREALHHMLELGPILDRTEAGLLLAEVMERHLFTKAAAPEGVPSLATLAGWARDRFGLPAGSDDVTAGVAPRLCAMLEGVVAAPIAVTLARHRMFRTSGHGRQIVVAPELRWPDDLGPVGHRRMREEILPAMEALGWWSHRDQRLTRNGRLTAFFASAYGVTLSYLPMLRRAEEFLFRHGDLERLFPADREGHETHVDRLMNIWGSGGAHDLYFRTVDEVVVGLFETDAYPLAICDTGCGDGSFLRHIYEVLRDRLSWNFFARPVHFIGSDLNLKSREKTRETLAAAGVPYAHVVDLSIDINDPAQLDAGIRGLGIEITEAAGTRFLSAADALHTNSMLIHNRTWQAPHASGDDGRTDGAFVDPAGYPVVGTALHDNLVEFMRRWAPYVRKHGWLFIELHTVSAASVAADPSRSPTIAYDLTHGFSNQYTVEYDEVIRAAAGAELVPGPARFCAQFPDASLTRISVTYLIGR